MRSSGHAVLVIGSLALLAIPAQASLVTWAFAGSVSFLVDTHGILDSSVFVGAPFHGHLTFDAAVPDGLPGDPTLGEYPQPVPPAAYEVQIGDYTVDAPSYQISVYDNYVFGAQPPFDQLDANITDAFAFPGLPSAFVTQFDLGLVGVDTTVLGNDGLPSVPPPLSSIEPSSQVFILLGCLGTEITGSSCSSTTLEISAHLTSLPEPGVGAAGALAVLTLAGRAWARKRRSMSRAQRT
jgi:hypothetical protein